MKIHADPGILPFSRDSFFSTCFFFFLIKGKVSKASIAGSGETCVLQRGTILITRN